MPDTELCNLPFLRLVFGLLIGVSPLPLYRCGQKVSKLFIFVEAHSYEFASSLRKNVKLANRVGTVATMATFEIGLNVFRIMRWMACASGVRGQGSGAEYFHLNVKRPPKVHGLNVLQLLAVF